MNILEKIVASKRKEVAERKAAAPEGLLKQSRLYARHCLSLRKRLLAEGATGIIAEFKRRSPSKGVINEAADVLTITGAYTKWGASGLSVLTDQAYFGGSSEDLQTARINEVPVLRKDFIIDEYQVIEAKSIGADVVLLIAACLTPAEVFTLASCAKQQEMEVLLEVHDESELAHICAHIDLVGINNRNLKTFEVDINRTLSLGKMLPADMVKIAESGIRDADTVRRFRDDGFKGFLIGESFMKEADPGEAFRLFVDNLK